MSRWKISASSYHPLFRHRYLVSNPRLFEGINEKDPLPLMTRWPSFTSTRGNLRALDWLGTVSFALTGSYQAFQHDMDLLGGLIVGCITATGGGTLRDMILGNTPVFWCKEVEYFYLSIAAGLATFLFWPRDLKAPADDEKKNTFMNILDWTDAAGLGAFATIGAANALKKGLPKPIAVVCGMVTATFGGVTRDVLCSSTPRILYAQTEVYATAAIVAATTFVGSLGVIPISASIIVATASGIAARWAAWTYDIRLPLFSARSFPWLMRES